MANDPTETPAPDANTDPVADALRKGKPGVVDKGEVVGSAFDEPISGIIADIADGD